MFTKEIEKIKELTEKLKNEGDVTEDEADWLYIVSFIPWKLRTSFDKKYKKINFPAPYESMKALNDALEGWYYIVLQKAKKKETGNFLSTVFYIGHRTGSSFSVQPEFLQKTYLKLKDYFKNSYAASDAFRSQKERLLTGDLFDNPWAGTLRFSRLGTVQRVASETYVSPCFCPFLEKVRFVVLSMLNVPFLKKLDHEDDTTLLFPKKYGSIVREVSDIVKSLRLSDGDVQKTALQVIEKENLQPFKVVYSQTKDATFLERVASKLASDGDISEEDADNVFLLFKYAQALVYDSTVNSKYQDARKKHREIFKSLNQWYGAVFKALKQGKSGNFITTIPYYPECNMHEAGKNIKRCLELLPEKIRVVHLPKQKDLTRYDSAGLHFETDEGYTFVQAFRYGIVEKVLGEKYEPVITAEAGLRTGMHDTYMRWKLDAPYSSDNFLFGKLEAMKAVGVLPALIVFSDKLCIAVPKEDVEKVRCIAEIKREDLPDFGNQNYTDAIIEAAMRKKLLDPEDDSWTDITR
jgi:hypothetical protein